MICYVSLGSRAPVLWVIGRCPKRSSVFTFFRFFFLPCFILSFVYFYSLYFLVFIYLFSAFLFTVSFSLRISFLFAILSLEFPLVHIIYFYPVSLEFVFFSCTFSPSLSIFSLPLSRLGFLPLSYYLLHSSQFSSVFSPPKTLLYSFFPLSILSIL